MKEQKRNTGSWKRWSVAGILGAVMIVSTGCNGTEPTEQAPADKNEPIIIAEAKTDTKEEDEVQLKETPVVVDYKAGAEDILAQYTEEGMSRFKLNFPDTFSMEYALKNIGKTMPNFEGKTVAGKEFSTKSLKGKPFVLNFSKTTCPVCEEMSPIIKDFGVNESIPVVSLYPVDKSAEVETFLTKSKADESTIALVADTNAWLKGLAVNTLNIAQVPTLIFVDEDGRISYTYIGKTDEVLLKDMKEKAFGDEKLYDFVKMEVVKVDADGNEIKEDIVTSEPLVSEPAEPVKKTIEKPIEKEPAKAKESPKPKDSETSDKK
jgi:thiol-disulfide isomerase/thioredoxin